MILPKGSLFQNAIINGNFDIAQRGTSFAAAANGSYSLDRWYYSAVGTVVHTITQDNNVPNSLSKNSIKLDVTTEDSSIGANDYSVIIQFIEGYNFAPFVGKTATLSFWVRGARTGIHCVSFRNGSVDRSYVAEYTINVADTWEYKTIPITFNASGGNWYYTTAVGLGILFTLSGGSTYQSPVANSWQTGNYYSTVNQVNETLETGGYSGIFQLAQVQLNEGSVALPFQPRHYSEELALCQRYYFDHTADMFFVLHSFNGGNAGGYVTNLPVLMRVGGNVVTSYDAVGASGKITWAPAGGALANGATVPGFWSTRISVVATAGGLPTSSDGLGRISRIVVNAEL